MSGLEDDLAAFYDLDAAPRRSRPLDAERVRRREEFAALLAAEGRRTVLEVGTGPGLDAVALTAAGHEVRGVDLSGEHVALCRQAGIDAHVASVLDLPFPDGSADAGWTMSTLLHVPDAAFDDALAEMRRVLRPGSPLAIGLWAGQDEEGPSPSDVVGPPRFFSFRSSPRLGAMLSRHGIVERFDTWTVAGEPDRTYQWVLLRTAPR